MIDPNVINLGAIDPGAIERRTSGYVTYSYEDGISDVFEMITLALVFAVIAMIISLIIGMRKKDYLAVLVVNVMVKTVTLSLNLILDNLFYLNNFFIKILLFLVTIIIEGLILKKVLKYKKHSGMTISIICNIGAVGIFYFYI